MEERICYSCFRTFTDRDISHCPNCGAKLSQDWEKYPHALSVEPRDRFESMAAFKAAMQATETREPLPVTAGIGALAKRGTGG